jgi:hypothetical protein
MAEGVVQTCQDFGVISQRDCCHDNMVNCEQFHTTGDTSSSLSTDLNASRSIETDQPVNVAPSTNLPLSHGNDCSLQTESATWTLPYVVSDTYLTLVSSDEAINAATHVGSEYQYLVHGANYLQPFGRRRSIL